MEWSWQLFDPKLWVSLKTTHLQFALCKCREWWDCVPLWPSGQERWLKIMKSRIRIPLEKKILVVRYMASWWLEITVKLQFKCPCLSLIIRIVLIWLYSEMGLTTAQHMTASVTQDPLKCISSTCTTRDKSLGLSDRVVKSLATRLRIRIPPCNAFLAEWEMFSWWYVLAMKLQYRSSDLITYQNIRLIQLGSDTSVVARWNEIDNCSAQYYEWHSKPPPYEWCEWRPLCSSGKQRWPEAMGPRVRIPPGRHF